MREIKFRAWFKKVPIMIEFGLGSDYFKFSTDDGDWRCELDEADAIMQFTGLLDKNGKEIYEGDIVLVDGKFIGQVFWNKFSCGFRYASTPDTDIEKTHFLNTFAQSFYEVLGNIYENPEILKGDEEC